MITTLRINSSIRGLACVAMMLASPAAHGGGQSGAGTRLGYEFVGQVLNPTPTQSVQYGYLNSVTGLEMVATQTSGPVSEATALFSFYNETTTQQVINDGPLRVIDRTGSATIYFNASGGGDFSNPDTFRAGRQIQSCRLRHQVVIDTTAGYFTVSFEMTVVSASVFQTNGSSYRLGRPGEVYHWSVNGKLAQQAPPAAYIAGVASGSRAELIETELVP